MTSSERDRARIAAAAEASAYENEGDAERSPAHERGYEAEEDEADGATR